jgi:hypothetical protein
MPSLSTLAAQWSSPSASAWERVAADLVCQGRYRVFPRRDKKGPYLLRMWLTPPVKKRKEFDAQNSILMHYFFCGDDDKALHNHPWWFKTRVLQGWYVEHLPPVSWECGSKLGPAWDRCKVKRHAGDTITRALGDLHCVGDVAPGTFTLVETGPETVKWGFHPPGEEFVTSTKFLARK